MLKTRRLSVDLDRRIYQRGAGTSASSRRQPLVNFMDREVRSTSGAYEALHTLDDTDTLTVLTDMAKRFRVALCKELSVTAKAGEGLQGLLINALAVDLGGSDEPATR